MNWNSFWWGWLAGTVACWAAALIGFWLVGPLVMA